MAEIMNVVNIENALSPEECILFSSDRIGAIKKHLNPAVFSTEKKLLLQCFQAYQAGDKDMAKTIESLLSDNPPNKPGMDDLSLQWDLLRYESLGDNEKSNIREKLKQRLGPRLAHMKPRERGVFNKVVDDTLKLPSRMEPIVTKEALAKALKDNVNLFQTFSKSALGFLVQTELTDKQMRQIVQSLHPDQVAMLPNVVDMLKRYMSSSKDPWSYDTRVSRVLRCMTKAQLLSLPKEVQEEVTIIDLILSRMKPLDFDIESCKSRMEYAQILLEYANEKLSHPTCDMLKIDLMGSLIFEQWELDQTVDLDKLVELLKLRQSCDFYDTGRYQPKKLKSKLWIEKNRGIEMPAMLKKLTNPALEEMLQALFMKTSTEKLRSVLLKEVYHWFVHEATLFAGLDDDGASFRYLSNYENDKLRRYLPPDAADSSRLDLYRNPESFSPDERVKLKLKVKNVKEIFVKVFKINLKTYYRSKMEQIATDLKLEGLTAKIEWTHMVESRNSFHTQDVILEFPQLDGLRGVFFCDMIANGLHARAMISKGHIHLLSRLGPAGHVFSLINENREALPNGKIFMDGHEFSSNEDGEIYIPYSTSPKNQKIIVETDAYPDFCVLKEFKHQSENYKFSAAFYLDREQIMDKRQASLLIRSVVKANESICSLDICQDVVVTVTTTNTSGVSATKTFDRVKLLDKEDTVLKFRVPMKCQSVSVQLNGRIKHVSNAKFQNISASNSFRVNDLVLTDAIENAHLVAQPQGYALCYYGRNGEALPNVETEVKVKHRLLSTSISKRLMTDERGMIHLPVLEDCESVSAFGARWKLLPSRVQGSLFRNRSVVAQSGSTFSVPYQIPEHILNSPDVFGADDISSILRLTDTSYRQDYTQHAALENGTVVVSNLFAGHYRLQLRDEDTCFDIRILEGNLVGNYVIGKDEFTPLTQDANVRILNVEKTDDSLVVEVSNPESRLHVFSTHFTPRFDAFETLGMVDTSEQMSTFQVSDPTSMYCPTRKISEEQRYIVERARSKPMMGNMLSKPSFLMKPKASDEASTRTREAAEGESLRRMYKTSHMNDLSMARACAAPYNSYELASRKDDYVEFLSTTSNVLANLKPETVDGKHVIKISRDSFGKDHTFCQLVLNDGISLASTRVSLPLGADPNEKSDLNIPAPEYNYIDQRLNPGLDPEQNFTERKGIHLLNKESPEFYVADYKASEVEFYDNAKDLFQLFKTLYSGSDLETWSFLSKWSFLSDEEKLDKFDKYTSHELNFFIYLKDRDFFDSVVKSFIQSKLNKGLIDYYLLEDAKALEKFTEMHNFNSLNHLEKILLADAMRELKPGFHAASAKFYKSAGESEKIDPKELERLFNTVLSGKSMEESFQPRAAPPPRGPPKSTKAAPYHGGSSEMFYDDSDYYFDDQTARCESEEDSSSGDVGCTRSSITHLDDLSEESSTLPRARNKKSDMAMRKEQQEKTQLYRAIGTTKIYEETFYYNYGYRKSTTGIVPMNKFWCDFGVWFLGDRAQAFLSENMAVPTGNLNECLFALAVFGLDFDSEGVNVAWEPNGVSVKITAEKPVVVFSKEIKQTETRNSSISIHQFYFDPNNQSEMVDGERVDKFVTEFHPRQVYGCRAVLTNISSTPLNNLEVLKQIPVGAIALNNKDSTETAIISISAYGTKIIEFLFYFPNVGEFRHFPVQVAKKNFVIGSGNAGALIVTLPQAKKEVNVTNWKDVSRNADPKTVIAYLQNHNVYKMNQDGDLDLINWRLKDESFWSEYITILRENNLYIDDVWGYAFLHADSQNCEQEIREYNSMRSGVNYYSPGFPPQFDSPLLSKDAFLAKEYTHLEFFPLVNARAHQLGKKREILNDRLLGQYQKFIDLAMSRSSSVETMLPKDKLAAIYYFLIQDRYSEALAVFKLFDSEAGKDASEFCYDYLCGYLNFLDEDQDIAKAVVQKYKDKVLTPAKRHLMEDLQASLSELGDFVFEPTENINREDRDREMSKSASKEASLDFKIENREIKIEHFGLDSVTINYFKMDVELMFSTSPFSMSGSTSGNFKFIQPTLSQKVDLSNNRGERVSVTTTKLPEELEFCNVYVEISGGTILKSTTYFDSNLVVLLKKNFGQVQVINKQTKKPITRAYVKVYASTNNGDEFYKDGYTDIRGRFDYVAISSNQLPRTTKFALLVCTESNGSVVLSAKPPKQ